MGVVGSAETAHHLSQMVKNKFNYYGLMQGQS